MLAQDAAARLVRGLLMVREPPSRSRHHPALVAGQLVETLGPTGAGANVFSGSTLLPDEQPVIFIVDDDPSMRATLSDVMRSVGLAAQTFASAEDFLRSKLPDVPGCLVLDVRLPGQSGLDFQLTLAESGNELPVVFITGHGDVSTSVRAMKAGAVDFLTKPFRDQDLLDAVRVAIERDRERREHAMHVADLHEHYRSLTERERDIMALVVLGHPNKQVAAALGLVEVTVKADRRQIMRKMGARSLLELARMADRLGGPAEKNSRRRTA